MSEANKELNGAVYPVWRVRCAECGQVKNAPEGCIAQDKVRHWLTDLHENHGWAPDPDGVWRCRDCNALLPPPPKARLPRSNAAKLSLQAWMKTDKGVEYAQRTVKREKKKDG